MKVGSLGGIAFKVSRNEIKTFNNYQWSGKAKYSTHDRHGKKGIIEFVGVDPETISFTMQLSAYLGTNPNTDLELLKTYKDTGKLLTLTIGKEVVGNKWVVESLSAKANNFDGSGIITDQTVTIKLLEYGG